MSYDALGGASVIINGVKAIMWVYNVEFRKQRKNIDITNFKESDF